MGRLIIRHIHSNLPIDDMKQSVSFGNDDVVIPFLILDTRLDVL